jgi:fido (protein-threonine AMPylation protein)
MPGKPFQSKLIPYTDEILARLEAGGSYRQVAEGLNRKHGLTVTHNAVFSFAKRRRTKRGSQLFYEGLSPDIREQLLKQVAACWTHDSTAIEGNTLTLGETVKVLELGLTIRGKPLREHQEVYGHARAINLVYRMLRRPAVTEEDLFALHRAVMDPSPLDVLNPVGDWRQSDNGTTGVVNGRIAYRTYADPLDVPHLMKRWLAEFNRTLDAAHRPTTAIEAYVRAHMGFVRIHPFFDGNGRVARLIANIPVLRGGLPPIVIPKERRGDYIELLWDYQNAQGTIQRKSPLMPPHPAIERFKALLNEEWQRTLVLVEDARKREIKRQARLKSPKPRPLRLKARLGSTPRRPE